MIEGDGKAIKSAGIVASAATDKATRLKIGGSRGERQDRRRQAATQAGEAAVADCEFIADVRGSVPYKRELMKVYVRRAIRAALDGRERTDGHDPQSGQRQGRLTGRPLGAAPRRPRQGHRPRRIHPHHARAGHAARQAVPQHGAHGKIKSVDTSAAKKLPGVLHVVTVDDVMKVIAKSLLRPGIPRPADPGARESPLRRRAGRRRDRTDPHIAEQAVQLITAEYEELPAVYDEVDALTSKVYVHDQLKPAGTFADLKHLKECQGNQPRARLSAAPRRFRQGLRRRRAQVRARIQDAEGAAPVVRAVRLHRGLQGHPRHVLYASQGPSFVRTEIARLLGWPENKVRIKVPYLGSGYGSKLYIKLEALALALSMIARKPVKVAHTLEEMFYQITRHPSTFRIKSGVDKNGKIVARKCEVFWNGGAYADIGPRVTQKVGPHRLRPLRHRQCRDRFLRALHQRHAVRRAARLWRAAARLGLRGPHRHDGAGAEHGSGRIPPQEPFARRRQSCHRPGPEGRAGREGDGQRAGADGLVAAVRQRQRHVKRGRGFAIAIKAVISPTTSVAIVNVSADGSATLYCGTVDMGQGSDTAMAQMVGEVLNIPAESVRVVPRDTDVTPYDMGTLGSRSLFHMGHAVRRAAEDARDKLKALAKEVGEPEGSNIPIAELFQKRYGMQAGNVIGTGPTSPTTPPPLAPARVATSRRFGWSRAPAPKSKSTPRPAT